MVHTCLRRFILSAHRQPPPKNTYRRKSHSFVCSDSNTCIRQRFCAAAGYFQSKEAVLFHRWSLLTAAETAPSSKPRVLRHEIQIGGDWPQIDFVFFRRACKHFVCLTEIHCKCFRMYLVLNRVRHKCAAACGVFISVQTII